MKEGIYLGPPPGRMRGILRILLGLALAGLAVQGFWYAQERARLAELRSDVAAAESATSPLQPAGADEAEVLSELRATTLVGAVEAIPPTVALRFVETVLPENVVVTRLDLDVARPATLTIAAIARRASDISKLQANVEDSPLVVSTELLEERRAADGELAIRLQVALSEASSR